MIFENVVGNEKNKKLFRDIINTNNIAHSYMFIGQESIGKLLFAREFVKAILCNNEEKPCNSCKSCIEFETDNHPDFTMIEPIGNSIKIAQIRELINMVYEKPIISKRKVYIINNSDTMTKEAQNSLLKTLEEPPEYITIILIASNESMFLPTIQSRCTKIAFNRLTDDELANVLEKKYKWSNVSEIVFKIANGSVEKALSIRDKEIEYTKLKDTYQNLENIDIIDLMKSKDVFFSAKDEAENILDYINLIFFDKIKSNDKYIKCVEMVEDTKNRLEKNYNYDMTIDNFIITIWEEING